MSANDFQFLGAMRRKGIPEFPHYFVGNGNLAQLATRDDRVCVLNILGNESRTVTPISHTYSGGNVVCGVQPGRSGSVLKTELNDIPVYNTVSEALEAGHRFNVAVVYVPPAVRYLTGLAAAQGGHPSADAMLAAICFHVAWRPLLHKRISVTTLVNLPWHLRVAATIVGASVNPSRQGADRFGGVPVQSLIDDWSFTETAYLALLGCRPDADGRFAFSVLLGLTASNGPGTISA